MSTNAAPGSNSPSSQASSASTAAASSTATSAAAALAVPAAFIAADLLSLKAGPTTLTGVEDDAGTSTGGALVTQARVSVSSGDVFTVTLMNNPSPSAAMTAYTGLLPAGATAVHGIGDDAAANADGLIARRGSQVLTVNGSLDGPVYQKVLTKVASSGNKDLLIPLENALSAETLDIGKAAAARLTGAPAPPAVIAAGYLPVDAVDPCATPASELAVDGLSATSTRVISDSPPTLECLYQFGGSGSAQPAVPELAVYTLTIVEAELAVPRTTPDAFFTNIRARFVGGQQDYQVGSISDPIKTQKRTTPTDPDYSLDFHNVFVEEVTQANGSSKPNNTTCVETSQLAKDPVQALRDELDARFTNWDDPGDPLLADPDADARQMNDDLLLKHLDADLNGWTPDLATKQVKDFLDLMRKDPTTCVDLDSSLGLSHK